jgi:hypothetical protein
MKNNSKDAVCRDKQAGKPIIHGTKYALLPVLMAPEDFGRSYNMDRFREPVGWLPRLRCWILEHGIKGNYK